MVVWSNFQEIYLFPSSNNPSGYSFQDNRVNKEGFSNIPLSEWPCFGPNGLKGIHKSSSLQSNSLSNERMIKGRKKENLSLLEVGTLDIPIP